MEGQDIRRMRRAGILAVIPLVLVACSPEESGNAPQAREGFGGETIVFKSNMGPAVVALHLDAGAYRNYGDVSEVGGYSDIGDSLTPCGEGVEKCVAFSELYIMAPPSTGDGWRFGGYDFQLEADGSNRNRQIVVVSRSGKESYSYSYSTQCGVRWINFAPGRESGKEVFYPVGRSLFSQSACTPSPAK